MIMDGREELGQVRMSRDRYTELGDFLKDVLGVNKECTLEVFIQTQGPVRALGFRDPETKAEFETCEFSGAPETGGE